jgi:hypothetical protein
LDDLRGLHIENPGLLDHSSYHQVFFSRLSWLFYVAQSILGSAECGSLFTLLSFFLSLAAEGTHIFHSPTELRYTSTDGRLVLSNPSILSSTVRFSLFALASHHRCHAIVTAIS